jgi:hypothetical protein
MVCLLDVSGGLEDGDHLISVKNPTKQVHWVVEIEEVLSSSWYKKNLSSLSLPPHQKKTYIAKKN